MIQYAEDCYKIASDGRYLPTVSAVQKLFEKKFQLEYGNINSKDIFESLESFLAEYKNSGGKAKYRKTSCQNHYYVVICTSMMLSVHEKIVQSSELVVLDASGGIDKHRHRFYAFVVPIAAGGLPLGVIITDSEKDVFTEALNCYMEMLSENAFFFFFFQNCI